MTRKIWVTVYKIVNFKNYLDCIKKEKDHDKIALEKWYIILI